MKKLLLSAFLLLIGTVVAFSEDAVFTANYSVNTDGTLKIKDAPNGSEASFDNDNSGDVKTWMSAGNTTTLTLSNYDGYIITGLTLNMTSNTSSGAGTFYFKIGENILADISSPTNFDNWYNNTKYTNNTSNLVNVEFNNFIDGYMVKKGEVLEVSISASVNSLFIRGYTITYQKAENTFYGPTIKFAEGDVFYRKQQVSISCDDDVDAIYYTTDGTEPTTSSQKYETNVPLYIDEDITIRAIAVKGEKQSNVTTRKFTKKSIKAIVAKYNGVFNTMLKTPTGNFLKSEEVVVFDNTLICNVGDFMNYAWLINIDKTIQDYKTSQYLSNDGKSTAITITPTTNTVWIVSESDIAIADRFLCYNSSFGSYKSKTNLAYPVDLVKGYTRDGLEERKLGTICLPYDVLSDDWGGATFYNIAGKKTENGNVTSLILEEETGTLKAGRPYIFEATGDAFYCMYLDGVGENSAAKASDYNGLCGSLEGTSVAEDMYLISNNKVVKCGKDCNIAGNRAYIKMGDVPDFQEMQQMSKSTLSLSIGGGDSTNIEAAAIENTNNTVIYNMQGQRVVAPAKGVYIVNGKKMILK